MRSMLSFVALALAAGGAVAQEAAWPTRVVKFVVSSPAGSAPDIVARLLADRLTGIWGKQVIVENHGGATGLTGAVAVARAEPDGYTIGIMQTAPITLAPVMYKAPGFNAYTDFKPLAMIGIVPLVLAVNPTVPPNTMREFIDYAKARPGQLNSALSLANSVPHMVGEMIADQAGYKLSNVPYNGAANATLATMAGDTQITINALSPIMPNVKAGKLKALAVTSPKRLPGYENIPTVGETIPGFSAYGWFAVFGQAKLPDAIADRINADINAVTLRPDVVASLAEQGILPDRVSRQGLTDFVKAEQTRWAAQVRKMGIKPE